MAILIFDTCYGILKVKINYDKNKIYTCEFETTEL